MEEKKNFCIVAYGEKGDTYRFVIFKIECCVDVEISKFLFSKTCLTYLYLKKYLGTGKSYTMFGKHMDVDKNEVDVDSCVSSLGSCVSHTAKIQTQSEVSTYVGKSLPFPTQVIYEKGNARESQHRQQEKNQIEKRKSYQWHNDGQLGTVQMFVHELFELIKINTESHLKVSISCSYMLIYMEKIVDLLNTTKDPKSKLKFLKLKNKGKKSGVRIGGLQKKNCNTEQDVFKLIEHGLKNQTFLEKEYNIGMCDISGKYNLCN